MTSEYRHEIWCMTRRQTDRDSLHNIKSRNRWRKDKDVNKVMYLRTLNGLVIRRVPVVLEKEKKRKFSQWS